MSYLPYKVTALARSDNGDLNIIPGATVTVLTSTGGYATLRDENDDAILNPFDCDENGERQIFLQGGTYFFSVEGGQSWEVRLSGATDIQSVATIADLRLLEPTEDGQQAKLLGHTVAGVGGGDVYYDESDTTTADNNFTVIVTVGGKRWKRPALIAYNIEMAGGRDNGIVDNKAAHEAVSAVTNLVFMPGDGTYLFSAPPTLPAGTTSVLNSDATVSGATLTQINAKIVDSGQLCGVPFAPEIRDKKIEIVCGTIRAQQNQAVTIEFVGGGSSQVNQPAHGYSDGDWVYVSGVADPHGEYMNGTFQIGAVTTNTYNILTGSGTPAGSVAGNVRKPGQWDWIKDGTHEPIGVVDTSPCIATDYTLVIPLSKTYSRVLSAVVCPDETIASGQNFAVGPSVALNGIGLRASVNKTVAGRVYYDGAAWQAVMGTDQGAIDEAGITYTSGNLVIPHSWCPGMDVQVSPDSRGGAADPYIPVIRTATASDTATINFISLATGGIYTGSGADTKMSFRFHKNYNSIIKLDGSDGSGAIGLHFGNIWFLGIMEV